MAVSLDLRAIEQPRVVRGLLELHCYNIVRRCMRRGSRRLTNVQQADVVVAVGTLDEGLKVLVPR